MRNFGKKAILLTFVLLAVSVIPGFDAKAAGRTITVDGDASDWGDIRKIEGKDYVGSWRASFDASHIYLIYEGTSPNEWDYNYSGASYSFTISGTNGKTGKYCAVKNENGTYSVKNEDYQDRNDATAVIHNGAHQNNPGPFAVEFSVDKTQYGDSFYIEFNGSSTASSEMTDLRLADAETEPPVTEYNGIVIDGYFRDWDAVAKQSVNCPNDAHPDCISQVACVWDGEWFYIFIKDGKNNASLAGSHSNGKFWIYSDLGSGYSLGLQLTTKPEVNGADNAQVAYVGDKWEIAIPSSELPNYRESLNFGLTLGEPLITGIMNLQGNEKEDTFDGITVDGHYEDWNDYPHSSIDYSTAGGADTEPDGFGALYSDGDKIYGHVVAKGPNTVWQAGAEFAHGVTVAVNKKAGGNGDGKDFSWRVVTVDGNGNINWNPTTQGLASGGTYEFYLMYLSAWGNSKNINNTNEHDRCYGKMIMTIGVNGRDEMEFYLDLSELSKYFDCDPTDFKMISAHFANIGNQWIYTAGTSSAPFVGVAVSVASVLATMFFVNRKRRS